VLLFSFKLNTDTFIKLIYYNICMLTLHGSLVLYDSSKKAVTLLCLRVDQKAHIINIDNHYQVCLFFGSVFDSA